MDALVSALASGIAAGRKALVFVRRVASVKELQRKLEECYDAQLLARLKLDLRPELHRKLDEIIQRYRSERVDRRDREQDGGRPEVSNVDADTPERVDRGGIETFFAWFFRG